MAYAGLNLGDRVGQCEGGEAAARSEGIIAHSGDRMGECEGSESRAASKGAGSDMGQRGW